MGTLANLLAVIAVALLKAVWARKDLRDAVRLEIANATLDLALDAAEWKARAATTPRGGADLRVRDDARTIVLPGDAAGPRLPPAPP